jgi:uncharacterized CHY-type Zn-finger protein
MSNYIVSVRKKPLSMPFWICPKCCQANITFEKNIESVCCKYCKAKFEAFRAEDWGNVER